MTRTPYVPDRAPTLLTRLTGGDVGTTLSMLWVYVLLSTLFRDVHEIFRPGFIEGMVDNTVRGSEVDQMAVLIGGIVLQLPLALVVLSRMLSRRWSRPLNIVAGLLMAVQIAATWPKDADDLVFSAFQLAGLALLVALAWQWPGPAAEKSDKAEGARAG